MNTTPMRSPLAAPVAPSAVSALTAVATPTAPDRPPEHDAAAARRFAELLRQSRSDRAAPTAAATAAAEARIANATARARCADDTSDADAADAAADTDTAAAPAAAPTATPKTRPPVVKHATGTAAVDHGRAPTDAAPADAAAKDEAASGQAPTSTEARADSLALLAAAAAADGAAAASRTSADLGGFAARASPPGDAESASPTSSGEATQRNAVRARGAAIVEAAGAGGADVERGAAPRTSPACEATVRGAFVDAVRAVDAPATRSHAIAGGDIVGLPPVAAVAPPSAAEGVAAAPAIALATPIDAPEFAAALGVQVSVLAQDGVQHAELHLNPAETGPVSIRISVDGDSARVDFGADLAATRHAIERGLPELASALRDVGLTLTGGGVSQHAGSRHGGDDPPPERGRLADKALPNVTSGRVGRRVADGGVDLYA